MKAGRDLETGNMDHLYVQFPDDVAILKANVPEVACFHPYIVEMLWDEYSQLTACASHLDVWPPFDDFRAFLRGTRNGAIFGDGT